MDLKIQSDLKRERKPEQGDKFFLVEVEIIGAEKELGKKLTSHVGWIEKAFIEKDFLKNVNFERPIIVKGYQEFDNENDYKKAISKL